MSNPQQPELRRSGKTAADADSAKLIPQTKSGAKRVSRPHGTAKARRGGSVPPEQRPPHPG